MAYGRKRIMMLALSCALILICGCAFCWGALRGPAQAQLGAPLDYALVLTACAFCAGACLCALLQRRVNLCLRLLCASVLFGLGFALASRTQASAAYFCLCYCGLAGMGAGFAAVCVLAAVSAWFPDRRGLCLGVCCGAAFLSVPLLSGIAPRLFADPSFTWRGVYLFIGLIGATVLFIAAFALRFPISQAFSPAKDFSGSIGPRRMARTRFFFAMATLCCLAAAASIAAWQCGAQGGLLAPGRAGLCAALGSCILASAADRVRHDRLLVLCACAIACTAVLFIALDVLHPRAASFPLALCCFFGGGLPAVCIAAVSARWKRAYFSRNLAAALTFVIPVCTAGTLTCILPEWARTPFLALLCALCAAACCAACVYRKKQTVSRLDS